MCPRQQPSVVDNVGVPYVRATREMAAALIGESLALPATSCSPGQDAELESYEMSFGAGKHEEEEQAQDRAHHNIVS